MPWYIRESELIYSTPLHHGHTAPYFLARYRYGHSAEHQIFHLMPRENGDILHRYRAEIVGKLPYLVEGDTIQMQTEIYGQNVQFRLREHTIEADAALYGALLSLPEPIILSTLSGRMITLMYDYLRVVYQGQVILYIY